MLDRDIPILFCVILTVMRGMVPMFELKIEQTAHYLEHMVAFWNGHFVQCVALSSGSVQTYPLICIMTCALSTFYGQHNNTVGP